MDYIIDTIKKQIKWTVLEAQGFRCVRLSGIALLVYKDNKYICVHYNRGSDLYDVSTARIEPYTTARTRCIEDVYCDRLVDIIANNFGIKHADYRHCGDGGDADGESCVICGEPIRAGCVSTVFGTRVNGTVHMSCLLRKLIADGGENE